MSTFPPAFVRVTDLEGKVHWINLAHVRQIVESKPTKDHAVVTAIHIDSYWVERVVMATQRPEDILPAGVRA